MQPSFVPQHHKIEGQWAEEYMHGVFQNVYEVPFLTCLVGSRFDELCQMLYLAYPDCVVIGVRSKACKSRVLLNPGVCKGWIRQGGGGLRSAFFCHFAIFRKCFLLVDLACLLVPRVSPVPKCCSLRLWEVRLRHRNFPATFRNFSQLDLTLPDRNPPPPDQACV